MAKSNILLMRRSPSFVLCGTTLKVPTFIQDLAKSKGGVMPVLSTGFSSLRYKKQTNIFIPPYSFFVEEREAYL